MGGYSIELFLEPPALHKEFICSICHDVLKTPTMSSSCEHIYCNSCITAWITTSSNTCPIDRASITGLVTPIRPFMNMYNDLKLRCSFDGCSTESTLGQIESHLNSCNYNPEAIKSCAGNCGASIKMMELNSHSCIEYLKEQIMIKDAQLESLKVAHAKELKRKNAAHARELEHEQNFNKQQEFLLSKKAMTIARLDAEAVQMTLLYTKTKRELDQLKSQSHQSQVVAGGKNEGGGIEPSPTEPSSRSTSSVGIKRVKISDELVQVQVSSTFEDDDDDDDDDSVQILND